VAPASVKTTDIYWGAIPFVCIQIIMVSILIFFPQLVTFGLAKEVKVDLDSVQIDMPKSDYGTQDYGMPAATPGSEAPPADAEDAASKAVRDAMKEEPAK
jgi:hypothetical protein